MKKCPKCGSEDLDSAHVTDDSVLDWECNDCGYSWHEEYE